MGIAIALIIGFAMGCGCTVALLYCLKPVAKAVFAANGDTQRQKAMQNQAANSAEGDELTEEQQLANFLAYNGTPQPGKDVKKND
jgi:hypothetical protein